MTSKYTATVPRTFEEVTTQLLDYIGMENLAPGTKLPPERALCETFNISRSSVREGLRILELLGFLECKQGEGTFVSEPPPFLIPYLFSRQQPDKGLLQWYFEIAVSVAQTVIFRAIDAERELPPFPERAKNFWEGFSAIMNEFGKREKNPLFFSLWEKIFTLLEQNGYLANKESPLLFDDFLSALLERDRERLAFYFERILHR